jgi:Putative zincin peptidase
MKPTQALPDGYLLLGTLDLSKNMRAMIIMNIIGTLLFFFFAWVFIGLTAILRPGAPAMLSVVEVGGLSDLVSILIVLLLAQAVMIVLHEGVHGLFFWLFTRARPVYAFKGLYAYAALPGWFIPRNPYLVTCLAPLVLISLLGILLLMVAPVNWLMPVIFVLTLNAAGATGDMAVAGWLLSTPTSSFAQDHGDAFSIYVSTPSENI